MQLCLDLLLAALQLLAAASRAAQHSLPQLPLMLGLLVALMLLLVGLVLGLARAGEVAGAGTPRGA